MLNINPKMLPRLDEIEDDLQARRARAEHEAWLGEVEGIDLALMGATGSHRAGHHPGAGDLAPVAAGG